MYILHIDIGCEMCIGAILQINQRVTEGINQDMESRAVQLGLWRKLQLKVGRALKPDVKPSWATATQRAQETQLLCYETAASVLLFIFSAED